MTLKWVKKFATFGASKYFRLSRTTLRRHLKHCTENGNDVRKWHENLAVSKFFDRKQGRSLVEYFKDTAHLQFGLTLGNVRIRGSQFATVNGKVPLRNPEATSLARSSAFIKH